MSQSLGSLGAFIFAFIYVYVFNPVTEHDMPWTQFSTKTAYRHCSLKSYKDSLYMMPVQSLNRCQLVHVNALFRHGTRSPSAKDIKKYKDLFKRLISNPNVQLPKGLRSHPVPFENHTDKSLLARGFEEHHQLGRLFRARMDRHFKVSLSDVQFYTSSIERAQDSGRSFYHGFSGLPPLSPHYKSGDCGPDGEPANCPVPHMISEKYKFIQEADRLLRFFDNCKRYTTEIESNKSSVLEYKRFREGPEVGRVAQNVMARHRLPETDFSPADVLMMYSICSFEVAAETSPIRKRSPWCDFFRSSELPVFEYMADLKHYWLKSYGYELNYVQSCPLVGEMLSQIRRAAHFFKNHLNDQSVHDIPRASFWFGHAETLLPVVAALGLFNDSVGASTPQHLYASGFSEWQAKRLMNPSPPTMFRAGHIAPFAGNLALQLYHCPHAVSIGVDDPWTGFFVQPLVNGQTVAWPLGSPIQPPTKESPGATFAPLSTVLDRLGACMPGTYEDDKVCSLPEQTTTTTATEAPKTN